MKCRALIVSVLCTGMVIGYATAFRGDMARRAAARDALACACASVNSFDGGTDALLAECYTSRGLDLPADL